MARYSEKVQAFMNELATDAVEERVVEYVIREVGNGRPLGDVLKDPYVKNRLSDEKLSKVLESPEVIEALEKQIAETFRRKEIDF